MKNYELLFILKPTLTEEERINKFNSVKEVIEKNGGECIAYEDFGVRNLAYKIQKFERGHYFVIYFKATPLCIRELERVCGINEDIIRFLTVKYATKKDISFWEKMAERGKLFQKEEKEEEENVQ